MEISMSWQATATLWAVLVGACLGSVYDLVRLSRAFVGVRYTNRFSSRLSRIRLPLIGTAEKEPRPLRKRGEFFLNLYIAAGDVLFFLISAVTVTVFLYHVNNGVFRWYLAFGIGAGFFLYYITVGKVVVAVSEVVAFALRAILRYLRYFLVRPVVWLACLLWRGVIRVTRTIQKKHRAAVMEKYTKNIENTLAKFPEIV
ncbi:MAG: spore cortex biosynthesis protein YabQ [Clostridia bacterium]|nr:spore cortex biosynthesis protein YabQ [Clostridia bacterium]